MTGWTALILIPVIGLGLVLLFCVWLLVGSIGSVVFTPGSRSWLYVVGLYVAGTTVTLGLVWQKVVGPGWAIRSIVFGLPLAFFLVLAINFITNKDEEQPQPDGSDTQR